VDDDSHIGELDNAKRDKEFSKIADGMPIVIYDPTIKEGRIGFFSSDTEGLEISNLLF